MKKIMVFLFLMSIYGCQHQSIPGFFEDNNKYVLAYELAEGRMDLMPSAIEVLAYVKPVKMKHVIDQDNFDFLIGRIVDNYDGVLRGAMRGSSRADVPRLSVTSEQTRRDKMRRLWDYLRGNFPPDVYYIYGKVRGAPYYRFCVIVQDRLWYVGNSPQFFVRSEFDVLSASKREQLAVWRIHSFGDKHWASIPAGYDAGLFKGDKLALLRDGRQVGVLEVDSEDPHLSRAILLTGEAPMIGDTVIPLPTAEKEDVETKGDK